MKLFAWKSLREMEVEPFAIITMGLLRGMVGNPNSIRGFYITLHSPFFQEMRYQDFCSLCYYLGDVVTCRCLWFRVAAGGKPHLRLKRYLMPHPGPRHLLATREEVEDGLKPDIYKDLPWI